jgi:hypothetical protein
VKLEVRRRSVRVSPPDPGDLEWVAAEIDQRGLWFLLGWPEPFGHRLVALHAQGLLIVGIVRKSERRVGFALVFPPGGLLEHRELVFAIPSDTDRDAFTAIYALDAVTHYVLDHLGEEALAMRVRLDNGPSLAPLRRMGFVPEGQLPMGSQTYAVFRIDREAWARRKTKLARSGAPFA